MSCTSASTSEPPQHRPGATWRTAAQAYNRAMQRLLDLLGRNYTRGTLELAVAGGRTWRLGQGEPRAHIRVRDTATLLRMLCNPRLAFGETYMDGGWNPAEGRLLDVLEVCLRNLEASQSRSPWRQLRKAVAWLSELNTPWRARRNVSHHYDLDEALYRRFLDADLHYSCAYFARPELSLEQAQQAKCALIARKLHLAPGARVLDIGSGWGGLALYLAREYGAEVTGITLSQEQLRVARQRAEAAGLSARVRFELTDYRNVRDEFDAVVSVGMFEHVGRPQYRRYFERIQTLLRPEGVALIHTIGRNTPPDGCNPWIRRYIFPGGYIPAASEILPAIEHSGLLLTDLEVWRLHYARTLAAWHERFQAARQDISARLGERFCRMWTFYLQGSEASFRWGGLAVFHLQLTRALTRLPLTRDYLYGAAPQTAVPARHLDATRAFP